MLYRFRFTRCMKQAIGFTILLSGLLTAHGAAADSAAPDKCAEIKHLGTPDVQLLSGAHWVCHAGYLAAVPERLGYALWLAYRLTADQVAKCMPQKGTFRVDDALPAEYRAVPEDYKGTDFEPLQMAPAADFTSDPAAVADSYLMTNTLPKYAGWVTFEWQFLEATIRSWAKSRGEVIVYTGPVISEVSRFVANGRLPAPIAFWKVVVDPKTQEWQAFLIQQRGHFHPGHIRRHEELKVFQTSIDEIERWSYVRLPLPATIDRKKIQPLWDSAVNLEKPGRIIPQCLEGATP